MRFDGFVRGVLAQLAAALLIVLLARPDLAPADPSVAAERAATSPQDDGMAATPANASAVSLAVTPANMPAPPTPPTRHLRTSLHPLACRIATNRAPRLPAAARPAPTVLRV